MKKFQLSRIIKDSLVITDDCLRRIFDLIKEYYTHVEVNAECLNGLTIETDNIDDILSYENRSHNKLLMIRYVCFSIRENEHNPQAKEILGIKIGSTSFLFWNSETVQLAIESESEKDIKHLADKIEEYLIECRPWYNILVTINFLEILGYSVITFIFLVITILIFLPDTTIHLLISSFFAGYLLNFFLIIIAFIMYTFWVISYPPFSIFKRLRQFNNFLFPKLFFLIGKQKEQYKKIEGVRNLVLVSVILAVVVGLFTNWLFAKLF